MPNENEAFAFYVDLSVLSEDCRRIIRVKSLIVLILPFSIASCVTGPRTEMKTPLSVLNGENYDHGPGGAADRLVVPVITTKERNTHIRGRVILRDGLTEIPLRGLLLKIHSNDRSIQEVLTDAKGEFLFSGVFKNSRYQIFCQSEKFVCESSIDLHAYEIKGLVLEAREKSKP